MIKSMQHLINNSDVALSMSFSLSFFLSSLWMVTQRVCAQTYVSIVIWLTYLYVSYVAYVQHEVDLNWT